MGFSLGLEDMREGAPAPSSPRLGSLGDMGCVKITFQNSAPSFKFYAMSFRSAQTATGFLALMASIAVADETFNNLSQKYTLINSRSGGVINQPINGFWWWSDKTGDRSGDLLQHTILGKNKWLIVHGGSTPAIDESIRPNDRHPHAEGVPGVVAQFKYDGVCLNGLVRTVEVRENGAPPKCPQYYWWTLAKMCVAADHRSASLKTSGYKHDDETCQSDFNRPHSFEKKIERFLGASFAPIAAGKYFHTVTVAAPAQFVAEVKLAWDYRPLHTKGGTNPVKIRVRLGQYSSVPQTEVLTTTQTSGVHVFAAGQGGQYHFVFDVYDDKDRLIHTDFLLAEMN